MNTRTKILAALVAIPTAWGLTSAPFVSADVVLSAEGMLQRSGTSDTAFSGEFCSQQSGNTCKSVNHRPVSVSKAATQVHEAVAAQLAADPGTPIVLLGWSLGGAAITDTLIFWHENPDEAPRDGAVRFFVTFGSPFNKYGGNQRTAARNLPTDLAIPGLEVVAQYDTVADRPDLRGWYSLRNLSWDRHQQYLDGVDINDPANLVWLDNETGVTYMLLPAKTLPMLSWLDPWVSDATMDRLDDKYRPLVEKDYKRTTGQTDTPTGQEGYRDYIPQGAGADWINGVAPPSLQTPTTDSNARKRDRREEKVVDDASSDEPGGGSDERRRVREDRDDDEQPAAPQTVDADNGDSAPSSVDNNPDTGGADE